MRVCAVGDDFSVLIGQQLRSEFLDPLRRDIQSSWDMRFAVSFGRERLDNSDSLLRVELGFQVFGRNCAFHSDLLGDAVFDAEKLLLDSATALGC
jgi:hypothetical protein